jgi:hypothetical protein
MINYWIYPFIVRIILKTDFPEIITSIICYESHMKYNLVDQHYVIFSRHGSYFSLKALKVY